MLKFALPPDCQRASIDHKRDNGICAATGTTFFVSILRGLVSLVLLNMVLNTHMQLRKYVCISILSGEISESSWWDCQDPLALCYVLLTGCPFFILVPDSDF